MRVLFLDLDTLRPDHLGCYGYHRNTSPNIDQVAREGMRFDNYYCSDAPCLPSRAALMTGKFGIRSGVVGHGGTAADMRLQGAKRRFKSDLASTLPGVLRSKGLRTASISPFAERHSAWWFNAGFLETHNTGECGDESAEKVTPTALDWIRRNAQTDNWFLHLNYWDPHGPYRAPASFGNPFAADALPQWFTEDVVGQHRQLVGPHCAHELNMYDNRSYPQFPRHPNEVRNLTDVRRVIDGYDCGIRYMDGHIGMLFDALKVAGVFDDLMIIISSDHGENLGELGIYVEHGTSDYVTHRIPMIIRSPGAKPGVAKGLHYSLDLLPTLAEKFGAAKTADWDGESFAETLCQGQDRGRPYLVLSQCAHVCQRSVRFGPWHYIRTYHDGFHLFPREMLFNIELDPHEQNNLAEQHVDICREAVYWLTDWHENQMAKVPDGIDPLRTVLLEGGPYHALPNALPKYCEFLKQTGREWAIEQLRARHPAAPQ